MQITLEQLEEIAKAGYMGNQPVIIDCLYDSGYPSSVVQIDNLYILRIECTDSILGVIYEPILGLRYESKASVEIGVHYPKFNIPAAIRKMEELGLIEK